ncbi:MAG: exodeoxyribonuclease III [Filifactoraceae bacterium]
MKFISWNVNGLRAVLDKNFLEFMEAETPDFMCLQETKLQKEQIPEKLTDFLKEKGYHHYWDCAVKKGYSGTALFTKEEPLSISYGIGLDEHDQEGRVITAEYKDFYLVTVYTPNSKSELERLDYRMTWEDEFRAYLLKLDSNKPVIVCGDLNVAHKEIDLKNPKTNTKNAGFTIEERNKFTELLASGFTDSFRFFYPDLEQVYSWWSYRFRAREKNTGWRIDYFVVSNRLEGKLKGAKIHMDVLGSDHCPVELVI